MLLTGLAGVKRSGGVRSCDTQTRQGTSADHTGWETLLAKLANSDEVNGKLSRKAGCAWVSFAHSVSHSRDVEFGYEML